MKPTVAVLGASGVLGPIVARRFDERGWTVTTASRRGDRSYDPLDERSVAAAVEGAAVVVAPLPTVPIPLLIGVLRTGAILLTVGALSLAQRRILASVDTKGLPGVAVLNAGTSPGLTNLAAAGLVSRRPDSDGIQVAQMLSARGTAGKGGLEYAIERLRSSRTHQTVLLPFPVEGTLRAFDVSDDHDAWLDSVSGDRRIRLLLVFPERPISVLVHVVNALHLCRLLPARLPGFQPSPRGVTREPFSEWVAVTKDGKVLDAVTIEGRGDYWTTAATVEVQAALLLERFRAGALTPGVSSIEEILDLDEVLSRLSDDLTIRVVRQSSPCT